MSYALLVLLLGLATYGLGAAAGSALLAAAWRGSRRLRGLSGARGARWLLALRAFPPAFGLVTAALLATPAFVAHEPLHGEHHEELSAGLVALGLLGLLPVLLGLARGLRALSASQRLERDWTARARPLSLPGLDLPACRLAHPFPVAAVTGVLSPRLYLADSVLATLSPGELEATCAHERAHAAAHDNLKALLLRACPDWLGPLPLGRELERAWLEAAEQAADDLAARGGTARAVDLAGALVKTARLVPPGRRLAEAALALHGGQLAARVERLLGARGRESGGAAAAWLLAASLVALLAPLALPGSSRLIHSLLELLVQLAA